MAKELVVTAELFKRIKEAAPGEEVVGSVHMHLRPSGKCNVVYAGGKPIACTMRLQKRTKSPAHSIVFRRQ